MSNVVSKRVARPALITCVVVNMGGVEILMIIVRRPRTVKAIARAAAAAKVRQMCVPHITCTIHKITDGT